MDLGLNNQFKYPDIATVIKVGLMEFLANVVRIGTGTEKWFLDDQPGGGIKKGDLE
jgi:hypothetical protein